MPQLPLPQPCESPSNDPDRKDWPIPTTLKTRFGPTALMTGASDGIGFAARAGMQMGRAETPETVARVAVAALPGGGTVRPGFLAKLLGWSLATMPRWGRVRVLGLIMRGMTPKAKG